MTEQEDDLVQLLRDAFEENAALAPEADLTGAVVRRGRRVRARRRTAVAVVGAAAVAAGVVLGVTLAPGTPHGSAPIATVPTPTPSATPSQQSTTPAPPTVSPSSRPSSPASPSASESPWPPSGPPRLVRYPGQGVTVTGPGQVDRLHGTSRAFRDFVAGYLPAGSPGCGPGAITVRAWRSDGYAVGDVFDCPGGAAAIFGAPDGRWRLLIASQALWSCHALRAWSVPSVIAGDTCEGPTGAKPYHHR